MINVFTWRQKTEPIAEIKMH